MVVLVRSFRLKVRAGRAAGAILHTLQITPTSVRTIVGAAVQGFASGYRWRVVLLEVYAILALGRGGDLLRDCAI
jgi:hypothetical protein